MWYKQQQSYLSVCTYFIYFIYRFTFAVCFWSGIQLSEGPQSIYSDLIFALNVFARSTENGNQARPSRIKVGSSPCNINVWIRKVRFFTTLRSHPKDIGVDTNNKYWPNYITMDINSHPIVQAGVIIITRQIIHSKYILK